MACFGEILLSDPEPMDWEDALVVEPMDWLQAEEPMEWEETPLLVSQSSRTKVSLPVTKSEQPKLPAEGTSVSSKVRPVHRARVPVPQKVSLPTCLKVDPPGLQEDTPRPRKVKRRPSFDSSEEEEVADDHKRRACLRL
ncbi:hypothetical protein CDAR_274611 [Caerostris darwini]|uniref:Uncharacterized protein n=1 Tax=Caerostris darwini TaxID=1538125 RepID=A0AAV4RGF3_9ARAC|nr:hypothetical protein CDAR_274611 [Caerostris darwini]